MNLSGKPVMLIIAINTDLRCWVSGAGATAEALRWGYPEGDAIFLQASLRLGCHNSED